MYSPKIDEELIPVLYHLAKEKQTPMTRFVNSIICDFLKSLVENERSVPNGTKLNNCKSIGAKPHQSRI
jgi:hypothetical protein